MGPNQAQIPVCLGRSDSLTQLFPHLQRPGGLSQPRALALMIHSELLKSLDGSCDDWLKDAPRSVWREWRARTLQCELKACALTCLQRRGIHRHRQRR